MSVTCSRCKRPMYAGGFCIFHDPDSGKDHKTFQIQVLEELAEDGEVLNLSGASYTGNWEFLWGKSTAKEIILDEATLSSLHLKNFQCKGISCQKTTLGGGLILEHVTTNRITIVGAHVLSGNLTLRQCIVKQGTDISPTTCTTRVSVDGKSKFEGGFHLGGDFRQRVSISQTRFDGTFSLNGSILGDGITFSNVDFVKDTSLKPHSGGLPFVFSNVRFMGRTELAQVGHKNSFPTFHECDLSGVRMINQLSFYPDELEAINEKIVDCAWPRKVPRWFRWQRFHVADEFDRSKTIFLTRFAAWIAKRIKVLFNRDYSWCERVIGSAKTDHTELVKLIRLYRLLHRAYYEGSEFTEACEFYIGFMTVKRKANKGRFWARAVDRLYAVLSRYGESIGRPLSALLLTWVSSTWLLMWMGLPLDSKTPDKLISYSLQADGTFFLFIGDFWRALLVNFASLSFFKAGAYVPKPFSDQSIVLIVEMILNVVFLGFLALAIRRQFAPKKPLD